MDCEKTIEKATFSGNDYYLTTVTDDEVNVIEDLLGIAYVACQTYITKVVSDIKWLHKSSDKSNPACMFKTTSDSKDSILSFGSQVIPSVGYTKVQIIDAFANYFKHRDEWSVDWHELDPKSEKTAKIIMAAGASSGCTVNLRRASEVLGNEIFKNTMIFFDIVDKWYKKLYECYKAEFKNMGLI